MNKKVLILCTGNSCRSQMAHGILKSLDKELKVFSAGTKPAEAVNPLAVRVLSEIGIDISGHRPHAVSEYLDEPWDFVITVCGGARETCPAFSGSVAKRLHIGFDDPSEAVGSEEYVLGEFRRVRDEIKKEITKFYIVEVMGLRLPHCCCQDKPGE
jgi:Protein-tyrosine-phosphatase